MVTDRQLVSPDHVDRPIRIGLVIDRYSRFGGAEGSTSMIVRSLSGQEFQFFVFVLELPDQADIDALADLGVELICGGPGGLRTWWSLIRVVRRLQPDFLHAVLDRSEIVARIAGIATRTPVVASLVNLKYGHESKSELRQGWKLEGHRLRMLILGKMWTHSYHAISYAVAQGMSKHLRIDPTCISVVHRGRERSKLGESGPTRKRQVRLQHGVLDSEFFILCVGREDAQKGYRFLIEALGAAANLNWKLAIAGREGSSSKEITEAIAKMGISSRCERLGMRDDVSDLLCAADVMVFPSVWEGLGGSVLEAMALNVPIIAFDIPAVREATGGNAVLVPPRDVAALAEAIRQAIDNPAVLTDMVVAARQRFEDNFTSEKYVAGMADFYRSVASSIASKRRYRRRQM